MQCLLAKMGRRKGKESGCHLVLIWQWSDFPDQAHRVARRSHYSGRTLFLVLKIGTTMNFTLTTSIKPHWSWLFLIFITCTDDFNFLQCFADTFYIVIRSETLHDHCESMMSYALWTRRDFPKNSAVHSSRGEGIFLCPLPYGIFPRRFDFNLG